MRSGKNNPQAQRCSGHRHARAIRCAGRKHGCGTAAILPQYITVGEVTRAPIGWVEFCVEYDPECKTTPSMPRDIVLSADAWKDLQRVNLWVNTNVKPMTDMDHWGVVERWNYPDDGYGDCEDYVLQKRRMLIKAGWPREALLITVVRDRNGDGHAVLTVKTNKGEFILDNQSDEICRGPTPATAS